MSDVRYTSLHFSLANRRGPGQDDIPALLRRVADEIQNYGNVQVLDLILHSEITSDGENWPSVTVYYHDPTIAASYVDSSVVKPGGE